MASEIILRDQNFIPVLAGVTDDINLEIRMLRVNPSNGRLLVSGDGGGGGSGTVTSVSVVTANGISGSVATPTTTPAITLTLGNITPSSVVATGSISTGNSIIMEDPGAGTQAIALHAPSGLVTGYTLTLPGDDGNAGDVLQTNGSGILDWVAQNSTNPGGIDTSIQYNTSGGFGGDSNFTWDPDNHRMLISSDSLIALTIAGNGLTGIAFTSGGNGGGLVGMIQGDSQAFIAAYTAMDTVLGGSWYLFGNRSIGHNVDDSLTALGDIDGNNNFTKLIVDDDNTVVISTNAVATPTMIADQSGSGTSSISNGVRGVYIDPPTVLTTLDITLPTTPVDGQEVLILFGGTITSGNVASGTLTILPNSGQIIIGLDSSLKATTETVCIYKYRASNTAWYSMSTF